MWVLGGAAAVDRGYVCLTFDGPGQGQTLHEQGLYFRSNWESVITPSVAAEQVEVGGRKLCAVARALRAAAVARGS
jgi:alpha-beta hydrolase superfamily lysophospholipase